MSINVIFCVFCFKLTFTVLVACAIYDTFPLVSDKGLLVIIECARTMVTIALSLSKYFIQNC